MYVVIAGCGRVGAQLATVMSEEGHNVAIVDDDPGAFRRLGSGFNGLTVAGNGFDEEVLRKAGIEQADAFVAVTEFDNANVMAGQVAKKLFNVPKVVVRIYHPDRTSTYHRLGVETICGNMIVAERIRNWIVGREFITEIPLDVETQVIEFPASPQLIGKKIGEVEVEDEFRPFAIMRNGQSAIATAETVLRKGDSVVAIIRVATIGRIARTYGVKPQSLTISELACTIVH